MWMNEYEIEEALDLFHPSTAPNLATGAQALYNLMQWTNRNSDGWPYWVKPHRAAKRLMELLHAHTYAARFGYYQGTARSFEDVSFNDVDLAMRPIKSFITRQGGSWAEVAP